MTDLDAHDRAILRKLQTTGDRRNVDLAADVGLSPAATLRRTQRLRERGVLAGVRTDVEPAAAGFAVDAWVLVTLAAHDADQDARFARALADLPQVVQADVVAGGDDALLRVVTRDAAELHRVLLAVKRAGAARVRTMLRLQAIKPPTGLPV